MKKVTRLQSRKQWIWLMAVLIAVIIFKVDNIVYAQATVAGTTTEDTTTSATVTSNLSTVKITSIVIVSKHSLKITWKKNKKAEGYIIYHKNEEGEWIKAGQCSGGQKSCYTDKGLSYGKTYTYAVMPYGIKQGKKQYDLPTGKGTSKKLKFQPKYKNGLKLYYDADGKLIKDVEGIIGKQDSYMLKVNTLRCVVTAYAKDGKKGYTIPVKSFLCAPNAYTKSGTFHTGEAHRYRTLFYNSYSQWSVQIHGNILFHTSPYTRSMDRKSLDVKEYNKMGTCASHGCVRMQCAGVKWIYENCKGGTKVIIYKSENAGPFGKPELEKLPSWHTWDPTDPASKRLCAKKGCH